MQSAPKQNGDVFHETNHRDALSHILPEHGSYPYDTNDPLKAV